MQELKERLKTVQEMLTHANFIRVHAVRCGAAAEATDMELKLNARKSELEQQIAEFEKLEKPKKKIKQPELTHA